MNVLKQPLVPAILLLVLAYSMLHTNFNIYFIDDSWTISNVWNFSQLGSNEDLVFLESNDLGRKQYFSTTYYFICGLFLNLFGWTKSSAFLLNSIFIFLSSIVWWFILKRLPFSKKIMWPFVLFLPLFRPFFSAAHTGRADALTFLIVSFLFLQFIQRRYFLAGLLLVVAIETHIMGVIGAFYLLAYFIYKREDLLFDFEHFCEMSLHFLVGLGFGFIYYYVLHWEVFSLETMMALITSKQDMSSPLNNYILAYFTDMDWASHVWELILFLVGFFFYFKNKLYRKNKFLAILLLVLVISTLITRRENRAYFIYVAPAFLLMLFYTFEQIHRLPIFIKVLSTTFAIYFASLFYMHRTYDFDHLSHQIEHSLVKQNLPVVGISDIWFAAKERSFHPFNSHRDFNQVNLENFYLVETNYLALHDQLYNHYIKYFFEHCDCLMVQSLPALDQNPLNIYECKKRVASKFNFVKPAYPGWKAVLKKHLASIF